MKPHKHAEVIKAWADGAEIQYQTEDGNWIDCPNPLWNMGDVYRIKPPRVFPKTTLNDDALSDSYGAADTGGHYYRLRCVANEAIKQYILDTENGT